MKEKIHTYHPRLDLDYFKVIDSKEKAYWLGWIYAEGWLSKQQGGIRFGVEIHRKEEFLIDKFGKAIGFDIKYKTYPKNSKKVRMRLLNKTFTESLIKQGIIIGREKSHNIRLPTLDSREQDLAFLIGYFDGDGTVNTTRINSGSKMFLKDIKAKFKLENKIFKKNSGGPIGNREIKGKSYEMCLGAPLFNDMLDNYKNSMELKRHRFKTNEERIENIRKAAWKSNDKKFKIEKKILEEFVWQKPLRDIGKEYKVSGRTVKNWCDKWNISTPPRGYWTKKKKIH